MRAVAYLFADHGVVGDAEGLIFSAGIGLRMSRVTVASFWRETPVECLRLEAGVSTDVTCATVGSFRACAGVSGTRLVFDGTAQRQGLEVLIDSLPLLREKAVHGVGKGRLCQPVGAAGLDR